MPTDLPAVFGALKLLLAPHASGRVVVHDTPTHYYLNESTSDAKGKPVFAAAVKVGAAKVALHLMPLYTQPELLAGTSDALRQRMQGKTCFNFNRVDDALFAELGTLIQRAFDQENSLYIS